MYESDGVSGPDGGISESLSDEALAHADRSDEQDVLVARQELEGEGGVEESSVECDGCGPVEVFEAAGLLEAGPLEAVLYVKGGVILGHGVSMVRINVRLSGQHKCHWYWWR